MQEREIKFDYIVELDFELKYKEIHHVILTLEHIENVDGIEQYLIETLCTRFKDECTECLNEGQNFHECGKDFTLKILARRQYTGFKTKGKDLLKGEIDIEIYDGDIFIVWKDDYFETFTNGGKAKCFVKFDRGC